MSDYEHAIQEAKRLSATPEGRQLAARLQQLAGGDLQQVIAGAEAGDLTRAKEALAVLLRDPAARQLLEKLGGGNGF